MKKIYITYIGLLAIILAGCSTADDVDSDMVHVKTIEMKGFEAVIESGTSQAGSRGTVTTLGDYVGRNAFVANDQVVFTTIKRTANPIAIYSDITFNFDGSQWNKEGTTNLYWSDATNDHTFIGYSLPQVTSGTFDWTPSEGNYFGSIGNNGGDVVFSSSDDLKNEDLLITHNTTLTAQACNGTPSLSFHHALSSVRVVLTISGIPSGTSATVSDMTLLHQPTMYVWDQTGWDVKPITTEYQVRKNFKLWAASNTSNTFTYYGMVVPQSSDYLSNDTYAPGTNKNAELTFKVTYTSTTPASTTNKTYSASQANAVFEPGYNTTINISITAPTN